MALGVVRLTKRQRSRLAFTFLILNIILDLLGLFTISWSIFICVTVAPNLYSERSEVTFVFVVTGMYGTQIMFNHIFGIKICQKCYYQAYKKSTSKLLCVWTIAGLNTTIQITIITVMAVKVSKHIVRSLRHSLEKGMRNYLKDSSWKFTMDRLQYKMKCCGIDSYKDWYEISWLDEFHVKENADLIKDMRLSKTNFNLPVIPWSCCRLDFPMQCFHDPLQQLESAHLWKEQPSLVVDSIYNSGCIVVLRKPIESALAFFILICVIVWLLEITTWIVSRLLYTSCRNAIILDDEEGTAPGWIFGRGDCGWSRGPGLDEIMAGKKQDRSTNTPKSENKSRSKSSAKISFKLPKVPKWPRKSSPTPRSDSNTISSGEEEALMLS